MIKKILIISGLSLLAGYLIFVAFFLENSPQEKKCANFEIIVDSGDDERFVDPVALEKTINAKGLNPKGKYLKDVNTHTIQEALLSNKLIKTAEVFITSGGGVRAVIKERIPVLRVMTSNGENYYIDKDCSRMPLSNLNTSYLPLVTGDVKEEFAKTNLYKFALFLQNNDFWNSQIVQIVVHSEKNVGLISRIGDQEILMGGLDNFEEKLDRLETFYAKVLSKTGWNRYSTLNLKYDKQVVATKH
ncbi:MAG: hypothetical protein RL662_817 [Bacteroidota bacterium]|jgi:cell division protein FtsQ